MTTLRNIYLSKNGMGWLSDWLRQARINVVKPYTNGRVLDIGCGICTQYILQFPKVTNYVGVELRSEVVKKLKKEFPNYDFYQRNIDEERLQINDYYPEQFNTILLTAVIEHVFNLKHLMKECVKHLKPGGRVIITTPTLFGNDIVYELGARVGLFNKKSADDHIVIFNKKRFHVLANEVGLEVEVFKWFELGCNQLVVLKKNE